MQVDEVVRQLKEERKQIDIAIAALQTLNGNGASRAAGRAGRRGRRTMSAAARRRISQAMKQRWAERKKRQKAA